MFAALPLLALLPGLIIAAGWIAGADSLARGAAGRRRAAAIPLITVLWLVSYALATALIVRLLGVALTAGYHPVRSRVGWQAWGTERLMDAARALLFPIYSSLLTPVWLRLLGAKIGKSVEASTVLAIPKMTTVNDGAFLADDTMVASYELHGGWLHIEPVKIGKRAFVGNSGMAAAGRNVPKNALVAVLSAAPERSKKGSSWLGSPPVKLRRQAGVADRSRTFAPAGSSQGRLGPRRALPHRADHGHLRDRRGRRAHRCSRGCAGGLGLGAAIGLGGAVLLGAGFVAGVVTSARQVGCWSAGSRSVITRCGVRSCGATR